MKKIFFLFVFLTLLWLPSCTEIPQIEKEITEYVVIFDSTGGSQILPQVIPNGNKAYEPTAPTKEGYAFKGWELNGEIYDFNNVVTENITLYAKWEDSFSNYGMPVIEIEISSVIITSSGVYTTMVEVGTYIYTYRCLPKNFKKKSEFKKTDYTIENKLSTGGDVFYNKEGLLPTKTGRTYTECDIDYNGNARGAKRIVFSSDFLIFYTNDHYSSFSILRFI